MITFADNGIHVLVCFAFSNGTFLCHAMNIMTIAMKCITSKKNCIIQDVLETACQMAIKTFA